MKATEDTKDLVKLRGHHLICLQFYKGEGYNDDFIKNLNEVMERAKFGVLIVNGADDVCSACPYLKDGKCNYSESSDEEIKNLDFLALKLLSLSEGSIVSWKEVSERVPKIIEEWYREACINCNWREVCHIKI